MVSYVYMLKLKRTYCRPDLTCPHCNKQIEIKWNYHYVGPFYGPPEEKRARACEDINGILLWFHVKNDGTPAYQQRYDKVRRYQKVDGTWQAEVCNDGRWFQDDLNGNIIN